LHSSLYFAASQLVRTRQARGGKLVAAEAAPHLNGCHGT
jgi:hypothetical protein